MIEEEDKGLEVYAEWVGGIVRNKSGALSTSKSALMKFIISASIRWLTIVISFPRRSIADTFLGTVDKSIRIYRTHNFSASTDSRKVLREWEDALGSEESNG
jgi:hypothetical protein